MKESNLINQILLEQPPNVRLFRNSVGLAKTEDGRYIRYGLVEGSSDLIGWESVIVTPEMVGKKVAIFRAVEVKTKAYKKRTPEQINFVNQVNLSGGRAEFICESDRR